MPNSLSWGAPPNTITEERGCMPNYLSWDARPNTYQLGGGGGGRPDTLITSTWICVCGGRLTSHECDDLVRAGHT